MDKIMLVMPSAADGGVQRVMINLSYGMVQKGICPRFIIADATGKMADDIPKECEVIDLKKMKYRGDLKIALSLFQIIKQMRSNPDTTFVGAPGLTGAILSFAKLFSWRSRVIIICDNKCSLLKDGTIYHTLVYYINKVLYRIADRIVTAHTAAKNDIAEHYKISPKLINVIYHPLISMEKINSIRPFKEHPFFATDSAVLVAVGRLVPEKDFVSLIRAIKIVREYVNVKLIILGDGPEKDKLYKEIELCELGEHIDLYGYTNNVIGFLKSCKMLILSSSQEAFGNVLIEATACGIPVVATNCASGGPREIVKENDRYTIGEMCECGDIYGLSDAIMKVLQQEYSDNELMQSAKRYTIEYSTQKYLELIRSIKSDC